MEKVKPRCAICELIDFDKVTLNSIIERKYACPHYPRTDGDISWYVDAKLDCPHYQERTRDEPYYLIRCKTCGVKQIRMWRHVVARKQNDARLIQHLDFGAVMDTCTCGETTFTIIQKNE